MISKPCKPENEKYKLKKPACKKKWRSKRKGRGGLTYKQARLIANKVKGMTHIDAYKDAYEPATTSEASILAMGAAELGKPHIKAALDRALDRAGITEDYVVEEAKKIFDDTIRGMDKLKALKFMAELKKLVGPASRVDKGPTKTVNVLNIKLDKLDDGELMEMLRKGRA